METTSRPPTPESTAPRQPTRERPGAVALLIVALVVVVTVAWAPTRATVTFALMPSRQPSSSTRETPLGIGIPILFSLLAWAALVLALVDRL